MGLMLATANSGLFLAESTFIWFGKSSRDIPFFSTLSPLGLDEDSKIFLGLEGCDLDPVELPRNVLRWSDTWTLPFRESVSEISFSKFVWSETLKLSCCLAVSLGSLGFASLSSLFFLLSSLSPSSPSFPSPSSSPAPYLSLPY